MTTIYVDNIAPNLQSAVKIPGSVVQIQQFQNTSTTSFTGTTYTPVITGVVTPKLTNSKFLISLDIKASHTAGNSLYFVIGINGNYDLVSRGDSHPSATSSEYLESYGSGYIASATIYQYSSQYVYTHSGSGNITFVAAGRSQGGTAYMNKSFSYDDSARGRPMSSLIIQEIAV